MRPVLPKLEKGSKGSTKIKVQTKMSHELKQRQNKTKKKLIKLWQM